MKVKLAPPTICTRLLISLSCLLLGLFLFASCKPPIVVDPPETTDEVTSNHDETTSGDVTTDRPDGTEFTVTLYTPDGTSSDYLINAGGFLPAEMFRDAESITPVDGVEATFVGWEYSINDTDRAEYNPNAPVPVNSDMSIYPIVAYRYRVRLESGDGEFPSGRSLEFFVNADSDITLLGLTTDFPERQSDMEYIYSHSGYECDGRLIGVKDRITVSAPVVFTAVFDRQEIIYTVNTSTLYGELIGGGQAQTFKGNYSEALKLIEAYNTFKHPDVVEGDVGHIYSGYAITQTGTEWTLELKWTDEELRYELIFDFTYGEPLISRVRADGSVILPTPEKIKEDETGYYDFIGWRGDDGVLYSAGDTFTASRDHLFTAEYTLGEKKVYNIEFITDFGCFSNGSGKIIVSGHYGDALIPPEAPDAAGLVYGHVVYTFNGWDEDLPDIITSDAVFYAEYTTPMPAYRIEYYLNGMLYHTQHYYVGDATVAPADPDGAQTKIFSGWSEIPLTMPDQDVAVFATLRAVRVIYMLDGVAISDTEIPIGSFVTLAAPAIKEGYTVSGWSTEDIGNVTDSGFVMPAHDVVFSAISTPNPHKVRYIIDGVEIYVDDVMFGDIYTVRGIEVREGYTFSGWSAQDITLVSDGGTVVIPDADITFIGNFSICIYNVRYYLDGELLYSDSYEYAANVTLRTDEEQSGCTFEWYTVAVDISSGSFAMPAGDVDIYGSFSDGDNSLTYIIDEEIYAVIGCHAGRTVSVLEAPVLQGYTFSGWSCADYDIGQGEFIMPEGDLVIRGSFFPNIYNVYFWDMREVVVLGMGIAEYGTKFAIGDAAYCRPGYITDAWVLISGDAILEQDGSCYIMPDSDVHFAAIWRDCLTLSHGDGYWFPWFEEDGSAHYDSETNTLYIYDATLITAGESDGIKVVYVQS